MRLATIRTPSGPRAVRIDEDAAVETGHSDLGELLASPQWRELASAAAGPRHTLDALDYAPLVPHPEKVICVGLNYRSHILEMGRELPEFPTLFAKYSRALIGARDDITLPAASGAMDWEAELGVVIGTHVRHADRERAAQAIAGYTVVNDVTARDWQNRTLQWLQGKTFEGTTPVGPWLVTDVDPGSAAITCEVDGEQMQRADIAELVFGPTALVGYISTIITLVPGDIIATGTPGGVGHARKPPVFLRPEATVVTHIEGIGECVNRCVSETGRT